MNTPADKPDLPELPPYHHAWEYPSYTNVVSLKDALIYEKACRADERRKALTEAATLMENTGKRIAASDIRALIDKEPT